MNNVITCLSDSYSVSRRETYKSIVNYRGLEFFLKLTCHGQVKAENSVAQTKNLLS